MEDGVSWRVIKHPGEALGPVTSDKERLAEALAIERLHGEDAGDFVIARIDALDAEGDEAGVNRWLEIADWLVRLRRKNGPLH